MAEQTPATPLPTSAAIAQPTAPRTDGMAIAALVVGLIAPLAALFYGVPGLTVGFVAVFLGLSSRRRIKRSGGALHGGGLALAGWIVGLCAIPVFFIGLLLVLYA